MAEIVLKDIEKHFGAAYVIRKLNLAVRDREFVVLLGPSGCGKTTTLRAIAGLEEIDSGDILIDGMPVQSLEASERDIAFVFQLYALYPHLTAFDNIGFPLRARGAGAAEVESKVQEVARSLQITHLLKLRPSALSGGDMQRVAIARALVRRPKALLMDEPIGALDAKLRESMRAELKRLHIENGATTIYVTHDQVEAMALADRIAIMNDGVLQQVGSPIDVYRNPSNLFVAQFVGSPVMNVAAASLARDGERTFVRMGGEASLTVPTRALPKALENRSDAMLGVRPEGITVRLEPFGVASRIEAHIIEPLGTHDIVDLKAGNQLLRARTPAGLVPKPGSPVWIELDPSQLHFFDPSTGQALAPAAVN
jgi:multiple sugar transport system ATP-binding protein